MNDSPVIITKLSEFKEDNKKISILEQLKKAKTEKEINYILSVGKTYKNASSKIIRKWRTVALKKLKSFKN